MTENFRPPDQEVNNQPAFQDTFTAASRSLLEEATLLSRQFTNLPSRDNAAPRDNLSGLYAFGPASASLMLPEMSIGEGAEPSPNQRSQIAGLIRDLDSDRFAVRNAAHQQLATLGIAALPQLLAARNAGSAEVTQRVDQLVRDLTAPQVPTLSELQQHSPDSQQNLRDLDRQLEAFANNPDRTAARIRDIETIVRPERRRCDM